MLQAEGDAGARVVCVRMPERVGCDRSPQGGAEERSVPVVIRAACRHPQTRVAWGIYKKFGF